MDQMGEQVGFGLVALIIAGCGCLLVIAIPFVLLAARFMGGSVKAMVGEVLGLVRSPKPEAPEVDATRPPPDFRAMAKRQADDFDALVAQKQSGRPTVTGQSFGAPLGPPPPRDGGLEPARPPRDPFAQDNDLRRRTPDHPANPDDDMLGGMDDFGL